MSRFDPIQSFANLRHEFGEHGGVNMSVEASTTFTVINPTTMPEIFQGHLGPDVGGCYLYGRHFNPTVYVLGRQIAAYEGAAAGYCTASGLAAIAATIMQLCDTGDHVVASRTVYGGTFALLRDYLPAKAGVRRRSWTPRTLLRWRPHSRRAPVSSIASRCRTRRCGYPTSRSWRRLPHRRQAMLVVDNTFTPLIVAPITYGANVVVHSLTKFMNGASDHVAGAVCGSTEFIMKLMDLHTRVADAAGPDDGSAGGIRHQPATAAPWPAHG